MRVVSGKPVSLRRAEARGEISVSSEAIRRLRANDLPKKDVLAVARVAAVQAAKRTPDVIPYCHPLPIDGVEVSFRVEEDGVIVTAAVEAVWRTGVEMEALAAASAALLTIYDMLKPVDKGMEIRNLRLVGKTGGRSQYLGSAALRTAVVFGPPGRRKEGESRVFERLAAVDLRPRSFDLPEGRSEAAGFLKGLCGGGFDLILTVGGTSPSEGVPEAVGDLGGTEIPGVMEAARRHLQERRPWALWDRGRAVLVGATLVVSLPGDPEDAGAALDAILPGLLRWRRAAS